MKINLKSAMLSVAIFLSTTAFAIIPQPKSIKSCDGEFSLTSATVITFNAEELRPLAAYMLDYLDVKSVTNKAVEAPSIALVLQQGLASEAYRLTVAKGGVRIVASDYAGAFNGVQTLFQMMPSEVYAKNMKLPVQISACEVEDAPQFAYRGFMLDVARTWVTTADVKRYVDWLAYHENHPPRQVRGRP